MPTLLTRLVPISCGLVLIFTCMPVPKKQKLRVGHLIGSLSIGGAERQVVNLLNAMPSGDGVVILMGEGTSPLAADLRPGVKVVHARMRLRRFPLDCFRIARVFRMLSLDVVQSHMFWANLTGTIAGKLAGIKVIVTTEHGRNEKKSTFARWVERQVISRLADKRICVSEDIRNLRARWDGAPSDKLCVIGNGTVTRPRIPVRNETPMVIGTLGRMIEAKDFPNLIAAAGILKQKGFSFRLVIVGDGPEREGIVSQIKEQDLRHQVELPGYALDAQAWLEKFDIFAISSRREGQPLSLLEAMANGLPIVSTNVGAIPDTVEDGFEALLVPPGNPASLAVAIERLCEDSSLRERLGSAARARQARDFSVESSLHAHMQLYCSVLSAKEV